MERTVDIRELIHPTQRVKTGPSPQPKTRQGFRPQASRAKLHPTVSGKKVVALLFVLVWIDATLSLARAHADEDATDQDKTVSLPDTKPSDQSVTKPAVAPIFMPHFDSGAPRWYPPQMPPVHSDWVQLTSGEWLRGTIKGIRHNRLNFDSDKLHIMRLKMRDVLQSRSSRVSTFVFTHRRLVIGIGHITKDEVLIKTATGEVRFPRQELISVAEGNKQELKLWTGNLNAGISITSGNTDQTNINGQAHILRRGAFLRVAADYYANFSETSGTTKIDNQLFTFRSDLFIYDKLFISPIIFSYLTNQFKNIDMQILPGAGVGYQFSDHSPLHLQTTAAILYQRTEYVSTTPDQSPFFESPAVQGILDLKYNLTSFATLKGTYTITLALLDTTRLQQRGIAGLEIDVTKYLTLNTTLDWSRDNHPIPLSTGAIPDKNDLILTFGAGVKF